MANMFAAVHAMICGFAASSTQTWFLIEDTRGVGTEVLGCVITPSAYSVVFHST